MNRITWYIFAELAKTFLLALSALTMLMVMFFLIQEAWREKLTPAAILELIPYTLPTSLCFAIPGTILFAACVCYGRMSAANEITAIKAMGVSPVVAVVPGLLLAFLLSLCTVYLNDLSVSWGRRGIYRVILHSSAQTIYAMLRSQGTFAKGKIYIDVDRIEGEDLHNAFITRTGDNPNETLEIWAERARIFVDPKDDQLIIQLFNGQITMGNKFSFACDQKDFPVPLGDVTKKTDSGDSPSNLSLKEIPNQLVWQRETVATSRKLLSVRLAAQVVGGDMVGMTHPQWGTEIHQLQTDVYRQHRLKTEPWRRWANGFSCLCFMLVGAPLAIHFRRNDFWTNFAFCFLPILLLYYPLMMFGISQAKSGSLPPAIVWLGNIVLIFIGWSLLRKVRNH